MFDIITSYLKLEGVLTAETGIRIGSGKATELTATDLPVVRDAMGSPYIPGSSFKGVLRTSVEAILRTVDSSGNAACNPLDKSAPCQTPPQNLSDQEIIDRVCPVCAIFGSPWTSSKISIRDLPFEKDAWFGQFEVRNGVAIDRDTETAGDGLLYDFEVVPAGSKFRCEIVVENAEDWELGLLMVGMRPFERGEATLGGAKSRGLGVVKIDWTARQFLDVKRLDRDKLLGHLIGTIARPSLQDGDIKQWNEKLMDKLKEIGGVAHA
jgi:CRISPR-associated RAMP protein (TIGR02581 family)